MAYTTSHQLYAAATSTGGDAVASAIVPVPGRIVSVSLTHYSAAAGALARAELSLQSTNQFTTSDARNVLQSIIVDYAASGVPGLQSTIYMDVPVTEMDRIYLHVLQTSAAWRAFAIVYIRHA
jgi:hypothetical protein